MLMGVDDMVAPHLLSPGKARQGTVSDPAGTVGEAIAHDFAAAVTAERQRTHAAGLPFSKRAADGRIVFVHPDGSVRAGRDPNSALAN